ncbi:hypothetical protein BYT27DRAFT_7105425 [Phlegmacium glaucopus]|nr:hypothetical protein BYT27DRAFT_7105425 [Phlegmacium glaucopus]
MQMTKSTAAIPLSSQVLVGSVSANTSKAAGGGHQTVNGLNMKMTFNSGHSSGGYRPKGPPQDQELEDESGSEPESGGGIQVSKSVAQEKLKALAERRGIVPNHNVNRRSLNSLHFNQMNGTTSNHTTPIPVGHPYNLPPPAPPSTPRTTRRLMLSTELPESLRRNLLWERQLSKVNLAARRTASGGGRSSGGVKERRASGGAIATGAVPAVYDQNEREQRKQMAMARNRSWANDYHYSGW